ncbi:MAG: protein kinase domain-containing protein, partial [Gemmatimonadaceae bacterium]
MTSDLRERLQAGFSGSHSIEHELGGGGMARVFVATEHSLGRRVVIKVLSPELAADVSTRRFEREIQLAASLQQANIVPVLSAGETDGLPHYTMPFVEGLSLRQRLQRDGPPSIPDAIGIMRDVARALAYAHERGVVHRDIKPENVLLSGDAAVVTDFGIAKALANARRGGDEARDAERPHVRQAGNATITQIGVSVGTPAYMAPEQISADPSIDHRADIYSFGCLAYELISGAPPFQAASVHALFSAHIGETPAPLHDRNADVPDRLAALIARCLEKDPARRPQSAREILQDLQAAAPAPTGFARFVRRLHPRVRAGAMAALAIVLVAGLYIATRAIFSPATDLPAIAVIPFVNLSGDASDQYLADGVADGLSTALGRVRGIRVASRTLGYRYRGRRDLDAREVGRELGVAYVLLGSVQRAGSRLRVSAQLVNAEDNREVWAQSIDGAANDAFAVQDSITSLVVGSMPRRLAPGDSAEQARAARVGTTNPQAYDLYLRGRYLLLRRGAGVRQALDYLSRAIGHDSGFADAHASYAVALQLLPYFERINVDSLNRIAIPAANRALGVDSTIAQAWTALGLAYQHQYDWQRAEEAYKRAVAAQPP